MTRAATQPFAMTAASQPAGVVRAIAASILAKAKNYRQTRTAMRHLSEMSDWQLADIGLTRSDVDMVALRGPRKLATQALQEIAHERTRMSALHGGATLRI
ncbi:DUF1127 domain-containing protein [Nitratireductor kimnyeongensis]|uniref:DUF1127 domain-containing protein n=1 Tax=Nitratireductor kimnyeongensis TaxID=430679 RepID=A0ABW0T5V9_9HYPH|nr:DUF1127 domain-containing protein [Nitratireductor kimnyeongensis]QZZ34522.1 DUF1127 domain-containing protein [Nitratireductor kimnyeongensis]